MKKYLYKAGITIFILVFFSCSAFAGQRHIPNNRSGENPLVSMLMGALLVGGYMANVIATDQLEKKRQSAETNSEAAPGMGCEGVDCNCSRDADCQEGFLCMDDGSCIEDPDDMSPKG